MINNEIFSKEGMSDMPSQLMDPFHIDNLKAVRIHLAKASMDNNKWYFSATVETQLAGTTGKQEIDAGSPAELFAKVGAFLEELKGQS